MQSTLPLVPTVEIYVVQACCTAHRATEIWTRDARMILSHAILEEAAPGHITVEPAMVLLTTNPLLIFDVLKDSLESEFISRCDG